MGQGFVIETINFFNSRKPSFPSPFSRQSQKREYLGCLNALWKKTVLIVSMQTMW